MVEAAALGSHSAPLSFRRWQVGAHPPMERPDFRCPWRTRSTPPHVCNRVPRTKHRTCYAPISNHTKLCLEGQISAIACFRKRRPELSVRKRCDPCGVRYTFRRGACTASSGDVTVPTAPTLKPAATAEGRQAGGRGGRWAGVAYPVGS